MSGVGGGHQKRLQDREKNCVRNSRRRQRQRQRRAEWISPRQMQLRRGKKGGEGELGDFLSWLRSNKSKQSGQSSSKQSNSKNVEKTFFSTKKFLVWKSENGFASLTGFVTTNKNFNLNRIGIKIEENEETFADRVWKRKFTLAEKFRPASNFFVFRSNFHFFGKTTIKKFQRRRKNTFAKNATPTFFRSKKAW